MAIDFQSIDLRHFNCSCVNDIFTNHSSPYLLVKDQGEVYRK